MAASGPVYPVRVIPFVPLAPGQKVLLAIELLLSYARVRWLLRTSDLQTTLARLRATPRRAHSSIEPGSVEAELVGVRLGYLVWSTLRLLPTDSRCLMQALVLTAALARRGLQGELIIGVKSEPEFAAHAWVEHRGTPLLPHEEYDERRLVEV
jgi:hypothetical protein